MHSDFLLDKEDESRNVAVAFVLHNNILFSMRDEELPVFRLQRLRARIQPGYVTDGKDVLLDLYDADVEYSADALEDIYAELEKVSRTVLTPQVTDDEAAEILSDIAKEEDFNGRIRRNVLDTRRALSFLMRSRLMSTDAARRRAPDPARHRVAGRPHLLPVRQDQLPDGCHGRLHQHQPEQARVQADHHQRGVRPAQHHRRHRRHERVFDDDPGHFLAAGLWRLHGCPGPDRLGPNCFLTLTGRPSVSAVCNARRVGLDSTATFGNRCRRSHSATSSACFSPRAVSSRSASGIGPSASIASA
jgi:hypothetical protein